MVLLFQVVVAGASQLFASQSVCLAWKPSPDPRTTGYMLSYGTASGAYSCSTNVGAVTQATIPGLTEGQTYYFTVQAYGESPLRSELAEELVCPVPAGAGSLTSQPTANNLVISPPPEPVLAPVSNGPPEPPPGTSARILGLTQRDADWILVWFQCDTAPPVRVWQSTNLRPLSWRELSTDWIVGLGDGYYEIRMPAAQAGLHSFFRFASGTAIAPQTALAGKQTSPSG